MLARCRGRTSSRGGSSQHVERAAALPTRGQPEQLNSPPALLPVHAGGPRLASRAPRAPLDLPARRHKTARPRERHTCASSGGLPLGWSAAPPPLLRTAAYHGAQPCSHLCHPVASRPRVSLSIYLSIWQGQRRNWVHGTASPTHVGKPYHVTRVPSKPMLLLMRLISQTLRTEPSIDPTGLVLVGASSAWVGNEARYGRPARPKRLIRRARLKLRAAFGMLWCGEPAARSLCHLGVETLRHGLRSALDLLRP